MSAKIRLCNRTVKGNYPFSLSVKTPHNDNMENKARKTMDMETNGWRGRLTQAIENSGRSQRSICLEAGLADTFLRDILKRKQSPSIDRLLALAKVLDVSPSWLISGGLEPVEILPGGYENTPIIGEVQAGVFQPALRFEDNEDMEHFPMPTKMDGHSRHFGLRVRGDSMNMVFPEGCIVVCVPSMEFNGVIDAGKYVVVEQASDQTDEFEATVKELYQSPDGDFYLRPRSTNPAHQAVPWPKIDHADNGGADQISVTAVVVAKFEMLA